MMILLNNNVFKNTNWFSRRCFSSGKFKIIFFGTDRFSIPSLQQLTNKFILGNKISKLEVVTNIKSRKNDVHTFASQNNLEIHPWPLQLPSENKFDVGVVVSFGHLIPESIIKLFPLGIFNVHASLLPKWRGATPIVHSLLNGDIKTGVTIMRIHPKHFDTGEIILQKEIDIRNDELQPELHDKLAYLGSEALIECIDTLPECLNNAKPQDNTNATYAPKFSKNLGNINWQDKTAEQIYNLARALYGIQQLQTKFKNLEVKLNLVNIWKYDIKDGLDVKLPGHFKYIKRKQVIRVWCKDGSSIYFNSIFLPGKRVMSALDFRNGFLKHVPEEEFYFSSEDVLQYETENVKRKL